MVIRAEFVLKYCWHDPGRGGVVYHVSGAVKYVQKVSWTFAVVP